MWDARMSALMDPSHWTLPTVISTARVTALALSCPQHLPHRHRPSANWLTALQECVCVWRSWQNYSFPFPRPCCTLSWRRNQYPSTACCHSNRIVTRTNTTPPPASLRFSQRGLETGWESLKSGLWNYHEYLILPSGFSLMNYHKLSVQSCSTVSRVNVQIAAPGKKRNTSPVHLWLVFNQWCHWWSCFLRSS